MLVKYNKKKLQSQALSEYTKKHVTERTQERIIECGDWIDFLTDEEVTKMKVYNANFCKNRFCPMCAWRKVRKDALKIGVMMDYVETEHKKALLFLTLTAPNVAAEDLPKEITRFNKAFKNLIKRDCIGKINQGYMRKLEVTYNAERGDYHPHFHCVLAVNSSYFTDRTYVKQEKWLNLWRDVMGDDTITQVDVRRVKKTDNDKEIRELAKYAAKDSDYTRNQEVFDGFYKALKGRQVITYNGLFAGANKKYKAGELDGYIEKDMTEYVYLLMYRWGYGEYVEKERRELTAAERRKVNAVLMSERDVDDED